ncbi:MAG TPA: hypothetical protein VEN81_16125 [Planctomycetota bacterium]|nr:hypothetical protein [Planctomycetota bacterium]
MTLIELLVAFLVLLMLIGALVALTTRSLETWTTGETRKEMYDRAQVVLDSLVRDLRNVYVENEVFDDGRKELQVPSFIGDVDRAKQPRLRMVRTGNPTVIGAPGGRFRTVIPIMTYGDEWEVAYVMDPDPAKATLYRGVRIFDRQTTGTLLRATDWDDPTKPLFGQCFKPVESGILYVGFKFWTQYTTTWDETAPITKTMANSKARSGPEIQWDSTRRELKEFKFHRGRFDRTNPDFVYPEIVQITVHVESGSPETSGIKLAEMIDDRTSILRLTHTRGMPDGPALARIEGEWIEYDSKTLTDLTGVRRHCRHTAAVSHAALTPVRFGDTFTTEVKLPVYREAQEPQ